jgi:hypothetical protein
MRLPSPPDEIHRFVHVLDDEHRVAIVRFVRRPEQRAQDRKIAADEMPAGAS